jgi:hypothetical protein
VPSLVEAEKVTIGQLRQHPRSIEGTGSLGEDALLRGAASGRERPQHRLVNGAEAAPGGCYPPSAVAPQRIQPGRAACTGSIGSWLADNLAKLAHRRRTVDPAITVPVQAAGHGA